MAQYSTAHQIHLLNSPFFFLPLLCFSFPLLSLSFSSLYPLLSFTSLLLSIRSSETVKLIDLLDAAKDKMKESLQARADEGKCPLKVRTYLLTMESFFHSTQSSFFIQFSFELHFIPPVIPELFINLPYFSTLRLTFLHIISLPFSPLHSSPHYHTLLHMLPYYYTLLTTPLHFLLYYTACELIKSKEITLSEIPVDNDQCEAN